MSSELSIEIADDPESSTPGEDGKVAIGTKSSGNLHRMDSVVDKFHNVTEVIEFAKYLGIDPNRESSLLWIAQEAISAPLPSGWTDHTDESGNVYFYHAPTQESTWVHPLDDHYKHLVKRLQRTGEIKRPDVSSPVQSPIAKQRSKTVHFSQPSVGSENQHREAGRAAVVTGKERKKKKLGRRRSSRGQRGRRNSTDGESDIYDSCSSSCVDDTETSATDHYDTEFDSSNERGSGYLGRRPGLEKKKSANTSKRSRINSPLLRRSNKGSGRSRRKSSSLSYQHERRIRVNPSGEGSAVVEEMMDGTKSKDELQKLISLAKSRGKNPTEMAVQIMMTDPKIKCALCCFCMFTFTVIACVLVLKFAL
jgi:hypothetical protein|eukprot:g8556.t1